ncbi:MAG: glycosyltransferase [Chitinophagaceae bacterium]|nr:glycosyltransferase [Chitinophagaceae bacterium]
MKRYSIILPVKNGGEYLKACVNSILGQTLQSFDLLILENKSTDGTSEWLESLNDDRIKIYPADTALSIEDNWKRIADIPKNEFITLIGHDDLLLPKYLETMNELINANPNANLYQTHFIFIDANGNKIRDCLSMHEKLGADTFIVKSLQRTIDINGTGFMFRSSAYDAINGIPLFSKLMFADYALWFSLVQNGKVAIAKTKAFQYRLHQNTSQLADPIVYSNALKQFTTFLENLSTNPLLHKSIQENAPLFISHYCISISHKLLRYRLAERKYLTVSQLVKVFEKECKIISENPSYSFRNKAGIKSALLIDSNMLTRWLFRKFRKVYNRPIIKQLLNSH